MALAYVVIKPKRGPKSSMPPLQKGEIAITTDTYELFVGSPTGNKLVGENTFLKLSGGILTGYLTLHADPIEDYHAATKRYVDQSRKFWVIKNYEFTGQKISYVGQVSKDEKWAIAKVYENSVVNVKFATIKNNPNIRTYDEAWDKRYTLTYSDFEEAF